MPTGLPLGGEFNAAIPHVDIEYVNKSALALATLCTPSDYLCRSSGSCLVLLQ
jgi:mannitol/fructose-specific phosphotransferase system IIA component (Ntr-type)